MITSRRNSSLQQTEVWPNTTVTFMIAMLNMMHRPTFFKQVKLKGKKKKKRERKRHRIIISHKTNSLANTSSDFFLQLGK